MSAATATAYAIDANGRLKFLEGMRGLAALYVVLGHFCSMVDPSRLNGQPSTAPFWLREVMAPFAYGHLAVAIFIVISGYSLQLAQFRRGDGRVRDRRDFFRRRALRILPAYYACLAFSLAVCYGVTNYQPQMPFRMYVPVTEGNLLAHVLLIQNWSPAWLYKINGVLWSIAIEAQLYLLFPLFALSMVRAGRLITTGLATLVAVLLLLCFDVSWQLYVWFIPLFTYGMAAAHLAFRPSLRKLYTPFHAWILMLGSGAFCVWACASDQPRATAGCAVGVTASAALVLFTIRPQLWITRALSLRGLVSLGGFSYSLYLMHHPIQQVLFVGRPEWVRGPGIELAYLLAFALPLILAATFLFSVGFERPFISRIGLPDKPRRPSAFPTLPLQPYVPALSSEPTRAASVPAPRESRAQPSPVRRHNRVGTP